MAGKKIRVLIVDDHAIVREGLKLILERQPDISVVGEAGNGTEAVDKAAELKPDVIVMDIVMPVMTGLEATRIIHQSNPGIQILILTAHEEEDYVTRILQAGATGYMLKKDDSEQLLSAIRALSRGESFLDPSVTKTIIRTFTAYKSIPYSSVKDRELTDREVEVLRLIASGHTNNQIADKLQISVKTVDTHRGNIAAKLDIHSRVDLAKYAIKKGLISLKE